MGQEVAPRQHRISYSSATAYEQCPARYWAERVDHRRAERPLHMIVGVFMHEVTDQYIKQLMSLNLAYDHELARAVFDLAWKTSARDGIPEALHEDLSEMMQDIAKHLSRRDVTRRVDSEVKIALDKDWNRVDYFGHDAFLRMKLDLLEVASGVATVWDLKSGHGVSSAEDSIQLKIYTLGVMAALPGTEKVRVELYYPRKNILHFHENGKAEADEAKRWIMGISRRIDDSFARDYWPERPGTGCAGCPVFKTCAMRMVTPPALPPSTRDEAVSIAERILLLGVEKDELTERLRGWVDVNGPVDVGDMVAGYGVRAIYEYDMAKLLPILKDHGIDPMKVVKADTRKLAKFANKNQALEQQVAAIAIDKSQTPFGFKKAGA